MGQGKKYGFCHWAATGRTLLLIVDAWICWKTRSIYPLLAFMMALLLIRFFLSRRVHAAPGVVVLYWVVIPVVLGMMVKGLFLEILLIPSGSMEGTLQKGDFVLMDKSCYGALMPASASDLPFIGGIFSSHGQFPVVGRKRLPGWGRIGRGDVVVFRDPANGEHTLIKRCVALPFDTIRVVHDAVFIGGRLAPTPVEAHFMYEVSAEREVLSPFLRDSLRIRDSLDYSPWDSICQVGLDARQYGQLTAYLATYNAKAKRKFTIGRSNLPGRNDSTWILSSDEYFMMGDNRDQSKDSRFFGPVKVDLIEGRAVATFRPAEGLSLRSLLIFSSLKQIPW